MVASENFRDDLLHRINTIRVALPPLRERAVDIAPLAEHFLEQFGGAAPPRMSDDALQVLGEYRWPGNVRELQNVIERAVIVTDGEELAVDPGWLVAASPAETNAGARRDPAGSAAGAMGRGAQQ
jgi:DNA-binding NtrC family response regulator